MPETLVKCIKNSTTQILSSGLLPKGCIAYGQHENGDKSVFMLFQDKKADLSYYKTDYKDFPLPQLIFGFRITIASSTILDGKFLSTTIFFMFSVSIHILLEKISIYKFFPFFVGLYIYYITYSLCYRICHIHY